MGDLITTKKDERAPIYSYSNVCFRRPADPQDRRWVSFWSGTTRWPMWPDEPSFWSSSSIIGITMKAMYTLIGTICSQKLCLDNDPQSSLRGGSDRVTYYFGAGYSDDKTIWMGTNTRGFSINGNSRQAYSDLTEMPDLPRFTEINRFRRC